MPHAVLRLSRYLNSAMRFCVHCTDIAGISAPLSPKRSVLISRVVLPNFRGRFFVHLHGLNVRSIVFGTNFSAKMTQLTTKTPRYFGPLGIMSFHQGNVFDNTKHIYPYIPHCGYWRLMELGHVQARWRKTVVFICTSTALEGWKSCLFWYQYYAKLPTPKNAHVDNSIPNRWLIYLCRIFKLNDSFLKAMSVTSVRQDVSYMYFPIPRHTWNSKSPMPAPGRA